MPIPDGACLQPQVLIIDDDLIMRSVCAVAIRGAGYRAVEAGDGLAGLEWIAREKPALVLLDIEMPKVSGWEVLARLQPLPVRPAVIMMSGQARIEDRVRGLNGGADDYLCKPCDHRELLARINRVLKRSQPEPKMPPVLQFGATTVDLVQRTAKRAGQPVSLTRTEFSLLDILARTPGQPVSRGRLLREIWGYGPQTQTRTVDTHIWRLRQKLCETPTAPRWIQTVPAGDGYSLATGALAA